MFPEPIRGNAVHLGTAADIQGWIAAWPELRHEVEALASTCTERNPTFERSSVQWLLEELDSALRLLTYRVNWMEECIPVETR